MFLKLQLIYKIVFMRFVFPDDMAFTLIPRFLTHKRAEGLPGTETNACMVNSLKRRDKFLFFLEVKCCERGLECSVQKPCLTFLGCWVRTSLSGARSQLCWSRFDYASPMETVGSQNTPL